MATTRKSKDDPINPKYYANFDEWSAIIIIRRWNVIRKGLGIRPVSYNIGQTLKYMQRAGIKSADELTDLKKAVWYLQNEIHELDPTNEPDPAGVDND